MGTSPQVQALSGRNTSILSDVVNVIVNDRAEDEKVEELSAYAFETFYSLP